MSERLDTREGVDQDFRYMMFDEVADAYHRGEITLEGAVGKWACYEAALAAPRPEGASPANLD